MNWITDYVRPTLRALVGKKKDVPDNLWRKCPNCDEMLFHRELEENLKVCLHCSHHFRLSPKDRFDHLFDKGSYTPITVDNIVKDPLKFRDTKRYVDRLKEAESKTGDTEALSLAHGSIKGYTCLIAAFNFGFMGGSMSTGVGSRFVKGVQEAIKRNIPLVVIPSSGGARMQEGILSLMQMPRTIAALRLLKAKSLPYIVLLADPTTGGVSASFAMLGDITIAEPNALIGFAGRRVIENYIKDPLPDDFQKAEFLHKHGMIDTVCERKDLRSLFKRLFASIHPKVRNN